MVINNEYTKQAEDFLANHGATMEIERVDQEGMHFVYDVTIERGEKSYTFKFTGSVYDFQNDIDPTAYDVLACVQKYEVGTIDDFCLDFGYTVPGYKISRIIDVYNAVVNEYEHINDLFGDCMDELCEIE